MTALILSSFFRVIFNSIALFFTIKIDSLTIYIVNLLFSRGFSRKIRIISNWKRISSSSSAITTATISIIITTLIKSIKSISIIRSRLLNYLLGINYLFRRFYIVIEINYIQSGIEDYTNLEFYRKAAVEGFLLL